MKIQYLLFGTHKIYNAAKVDINVLINIQKNYETNHHYIQQEWNLMDSFIT